MSQKSGNEGKESLGNNIKECCGGDAYILWLDKCLAHLVNTFPKLIQSMGQSIFLRFTFVYFITKGFLNIEP